MSIVVFGIYGAVGRILMIFIRKFPPLVWFAEKIHFPVDCDLCLGFWVYFGLALMFGLDVFYPAQYIPILSEAITGAVMSLLVNLIRIGWNSEYRIMQVG